MNEAGFRRILPDQMSGSGHTVGTSRHPNVINPMLSRRVCFYKSGDPQFNGLRMVINNRTFKTFDALLDSLSKKVPLPFGVRNITTPRGVHAIYTLDELEDGKSYICSDRRKVKPINLALARKKLPPWYHAAPVSSHRPPMQQARFFPGRAIHKQEPVRTPKTLVVFRNGDPSVKHTVMLQKRTTPTFVSLLDYISELMQFHVVKLHTLEGRRVDGLPGLIMCSGTVVAAGREPFKVADYDTQKSPAPTQLPTNRRGFRRRKAVNRKKKSMSRNFSLSSERYIMNRIQSSIAESSCDLPSNPTNSIELDSNRILESVAETEGDAYQGDRAEGQDCCLPTDDDIEKSFRVNQDGSMTVEMRVRLTIKEEETVHWTTTLKRSSVTNQMNSTCLPKPLPEEEISFPKSNSIDSHIPIAPIDNKNKTKHNNEDDDPPSLDKRTVGEESYEEDNVNVHTNIVSPSQAPTPVHNHFRKDQASMESIKSVTADMIQEDMVGSYSYKEQTENGAMTEGYCMVKQSSTRPVPKPRRLSSVDTNSINSRNAATFKSAGMTEILQIEPGREEVTETVLHIYEEQICNDNFFANSRPMFGRPATSDTALSFSNNDVGTEAGRPSTASESISIWRAESMSLRSNFTLPSLKNGVDHTSQQATEALQHYSEPSTDSSKEKASKAKRTSAKPKVIKKHVHRIMSPGKRQKQNTVEANENQKKVKNFSSAQFIKKIYGYKPKSGKRAVKLQKKSTQDGDVATKRSEVLDDTIKGVINDPNIPSQMEKSETVSSEKHRSDVPPDEIIQPQGALTSMHQEIKSKNESYGVTGSMSLPCLNSSSSVINEYVENWLEKANFNPTDSLDEERSKSEALTESRMPCDIESLCGSTVKQRIQSFENKSSNPSLEKTKITQQTSRSQTTNTENGNNLTETNTKEINSVSNNSSETNPPTNEKPSVSHVENKSPSIKISLETIPSNILSVEKTLPSTESPVETELSNTEHSAMDVASMASSPLYRLSSVSSQSDNQPVPVSPISDTTVSPSDHTVEIITSSQTEMSSTLEEAELPRVLSMQKSRLVSNRSLERKMSLKKASLDKYALGSDLETTASTTAIKNESGNRLSESISPRATQSPRKSLSENTPHDPSCCISASPTSLISDERTSSASISSNVAPTPTNPKVKETKAVKAPSQISAQKDSPSPKPVVKKIKHSPSPERKLQTKGSSSKKSNLPNNSPKLATLSHRSLDKTTSPSLVRKHPAPNITPSTERKQLQNRLSPYSQSLDMTSPPVRLRSNKNLLSRNLSSDSALESINKTQRKSSSHRKHNQTPQSINEMPERDKTLSCDTLDADENNKIDGLPKEMQPILEKICYSINSIRQMTQNKPPSHLERSNSLPDFSSQVASTYGSSSKALLAFLSIVTLKEGIANLNMPELNANHVSCAEAMEMINSLTEIASIEDSHTLQSSLLNLQMSASKQLLQSWKGFRDKCRSRSSTPNYSEEEIPAEACPTQDIEENVIDEIMEELDMPDKLKEELASLSVGIKSPCDIEEQAVVNLCYLSKEDASRDVAKQDTANVNVNSFIRKFTDINQTKPSNVGVLPLITKKDSQEKMGGLNQVQTDQATDKHISEEEQRFGEEVQSGKNIVNEENNYEDKPNQEKTDVNERFSTKKNVEKDFEVTEEDMEYEQLQESNRISENESTNEDESCSGVAGQRISSANKDVEQKMSCKEIISSSGEDEQHSTEEKQPDITCDETQQESSKGDACNPESHPEEEKDTIETNKNYVELNVSRKENLSGSDIEKQYFSEEEQVSHKGALSAPSNLSNEKEQESQTECVKLNVSANSDVDEQYISEEDQLDAECMEQKAVIEDNLSSSEEDQDGMKVGQMHKDDEEQNEEEIKTFADLREERESTAEEDMNSSEEDNHAENTLISAPKNIEKKTESQDAYTVNSNLIKQSNHDSSDVDQDSGNDHSSCEDDEGEQPKGHTHSSIEDDFSCKENESSSQGDHIYVQERYTEYQETPAMAKLGELTKYEDAEEKVISQSVAERVSLLEKQVADAKQHKNKTGSCAIRCPSQIDSASDDEDPTSESPTSQSALCTRSAPQSSLSFSYDSNAVITKEPEGSRVKSIREMFLAKSATDIQQGLRTPELSELRAETSASGGYQTQTSTELSSGEEDSPRKSITKGFVRRTIERLYGSKHEDANERPPSGSKQKTKEHSGIFSPFHTARSKASELSYLNSRNTLDTLNEATRCIAFNASVGPGDSVPIDNDRWLLRENTPIRKSVSDPVGIGKSLRDSPQNEGTCEDTENVPYSLFSTKSEVEEKKSASAKCTYFSLRQTSDSDLCHDDMSTVSKSSGNSDTAAETKDNLKDTKMQAEKNGKLPGVGVTDFKMLDNKVHPLTEAPGDSGVVVVQPGKGYGVVNRRVQDPDVLDFLYDFCGQHCPIL